MERKELIKKYIEFFKSKGHKEIKNSSLIPENDPTVLFTTAGMHPLVPFLLGEKHPLGKRLTNVQRCIRTGDIDEVGDTTHHTFFEMLGNWSLGDYFKKEAIEFSFEFLTKELKIPLERFAVTVFIGNADAPKDTEAAQIWEKLGISKDRIAYLPKEDNWWGPAGNTGPCGPDTEMFYWKSNKIPAPKKFDPKDKNWVEIWNDVLMQYEKTKEGKYVEAKQKNIDTGMGVERTIAVLNGLEDNYLANMWKPIIKKIEEISEKNYKGNEKSMRIIADHLKAACFIINDGIVPSNTEQGYVLRRLIRRAIRELNKLGVKENSINKISEPVFKIYDDYNLNEEKIKEELLKEEKKFLNTLEEGLKKLEKEIQKLEIFQPNYLQVSKPKCGNIYFSGKIAFDLYQSHGFPIEMTREIIQEKVKEQCNKLNISSFLCDVDMIKFKEELNKHQELSRTASEGRFKSGLADNSFATTRLHTATHLLLQALKIVLNNKDIKQKGSNITPERLRFDFEFDRKLTEDEIKKIEKLVNEKIQECKNVIREEMSVDKAKKEGATGVFDTKYGEIVSVYTIDGFSKEICTGPHVKNTSELGKFKIIKEESSSAGVRRIKAILE